MGFNLLQAQDLELSLAHHTVSSGDTVEVEVITTNFSDILSVQYSINWNPSVIQFIERKDMDLEYVAVGSSDSETGNLRISWFDIEGDGESLVDGEVMIAFKFLTVGNGGDYTDLMLTGSPLEIQVNNNFNPDFLTINNGSVSIVEQEMVNVSASINNVPCAGEANGNIDILVDGEGTYTFEWNGPNDFSSNEPDVSNLLAGDYTLSIFDADGIMVLDTMFSITEPLSILQIASIETDTTDCDKANGTVFITAQGGTSPYTYDIGFGIMNQNIIAGLETGSYPVTVSDANDCITIGSFFIFAPDAPELDLGEDITVCEDKTTIIEGGAYDNYLWSNGATEPELFVSSPGVYSLTITDERECTAIDSILVEFIDNVELFLENDSLGICPGDSIALNVESNGSLQWLDESSTISFQEEGSVVARPTTSTNYQVIGSNVCGSDTLMIPVEVYRITASAGQDTCIALGTDVQLNASGGAYYYWIGGDFPLTDYDIPNPYSSPTDSTTYSIMIIDENNCTTFDSITVLVANNPLSFIPHINMMTPNNDGQNDQLDFGDLSKYGPNTLRVFNRWGDIVFEQIDYPKNNVYFDGTYKGQELPAGNYYYVLAFREQETLKQTLTIVRDE